MSDESPTATVIPRDCITCDGPGCSERAPTKRCSRCRVSYYCSKDCQVRHYKTHKKTCQQTEKHWKLLDRTFPVMEPVNEECGICFEVHPEKRVLVPGCRHGFCYRCLYDWHNRDQDDLEDDDDAPTCCPTCRIPITQGVEDDILDRALYLGKRSAVAKTEEEKDALLKDAFYELDKLLSADLPDNECRFLLVKAKILRTVGKPRQAAQVIRSIQEGHKVANRNREKLLSLAAQSERAQNQDELRRLREEIEAFKDLPVSTEDAQEANAKLDCMIVATECACDLGKHEFALATFSKLSKMDNLSFDQKIRVWEGLFSSMYGIGEFEEVIQSGLAGMEMFSRTQPAAHKYVALSQKSLGDVEGARVTVNKGLLYAVMDEFQRAELLELYKELGG